MMAKAMTLTALPGIPRIRQGDDLVAIIDAALSAAGIVMASGDILVVAQKIVSKAEGRVVRLSTIAPSARALALGAEIGKDPRIVQVVLDESEDVIRHRQGGLIIVAHRLGYVMANAGVDQSNVASRPDIALLLPEDPDASADALRRALGQRFGVRLGVIINDSFGRAWRRGVCGVAIGASGLPCLVDKRGDRDLFGRELKVTVIGFADEIAAAASLVMGQADEGRPVVLVRGLSWQPHEGRATDMVRAAAEDLFR
jgi:coenzyme F420-0:L-glutamate ligase/coenzyme F420-1:gamma-L-glutamate ligase